MSGRKYLKYVTNNETTSVFVRTYEREDSGYHKLFSLLQDAIDDTSILCWIEMSILDGRGKKHMIIGGEYQSVSEIKNIILNNDLDPDSFKFSLTDNDHLKAQCFCLPCIYSFLLSNLGSQDYFVELIPVSSINVKPFSFHFIVKDR